MQDLEEHIAHLTRIIDDLNDVVTAQAKKIDKLESRVDMLMRREAERDSQGSGGVFLGDERPPHY